MIDPALLARNRRTHVRMTDETWFKGASFVVEHIYGTHVLT